MRPKKHFGQHFLRDQHAADLIVESLHGFPFDHVLEVGPGEGVLTQRLLKAYENRLTAVEVDPDAMEHLRRVFAGRGICLELEDFLIWDGGDLLKDRLAVIGNFPYNISSQILFRILDWRAFVPVVVGMFQKEVADRVRAASGSKTYGILSVLIQAYYTTEGIVDLEPEAFYPPPKVHSSVIRLVRRETPLVTVEFGTLLKVVKMAFNQRRKTLRNALKTLILQSPGDIPYLDKRAEQLSVEAFDELARALTGNRK